ncbi:MAG: SOS response-associated peptidase [Lapillicoccus sp.]
MCGRYAATKHQGDLVEELEVELDATGQPTRSVMAHAQHPPPGDPDWNLAPTKQAPVALTRAPRGTEDPPVRQLRLVTWGLVPSWAKDVKVGNRMINARADSVLEKPAFKRAAASRRCLVPADGWYEWQVSPTEVDAKGKPRKQPFYTHRADGRLLAFAGLYEFWRDKKVEDPDDPRAWLTSFTIITTDAEPGLDRIHDRQPLVLERDDWAAWLDPGTDSDQVAALLAFEQPGRFDAYPIGTEVNNTRNNGPDLLLPLGKDELHGVVDLVTGEVVGAR